MPPNKDFWIGKRVLLTGHTGFKGTWLSLWLRELGASVHGLSLPTNPATNRMFLSSDLGSSMTSTWGSVADSEVVEKAYSDGRPEIVLHLAAQALVGESYEDPVGTFLSNVVGTANVLNVARAYPEITSVVSITTDKCYENTGWVWGYREIDQLGGADPYSASKAAAELVISSFRRSFFDHGSSRNPGKVTAISSARAGNVVGGGDFTAGRLVPDALAAAEGGVNCVLRNPEATRPWQHVLEPLAGYLLLAERSSVDPHGFSEAFNFGPSQTDVATARTIALEVLGAWGGVSEVVVEGSNFHEAKVLALDSTKAKSVLNWHPKLDRKSAVEWTVEWAKRRLAGETTSDVTLDQIRRYSAMEKSL
jgi:CDP-glucose 4,6-dehydratase